MVEDQDEVVAATCKNERNLVANDSNNVGGRLAHSLSVIGSHLFDPEFTIEYLERAVGVSKFTLQRDFRAAFGETIKTYIARHRISAAKALLISSDLETSAIAAAIGFKTTGGFTRAFSRAYGRTPLQYKSEKLRHGAEDNSSIGEVPKDRERGEERALDTLWDAHGHTLLEWLASVAGGKKWADGIEVYYFLITRSREGCRGDRELGRRIAGMALEMLDDLRYRTPRAMFDRLRVEGLLNLGNVSRLSGDLLEADRCFSKVETELNSKEMERATVASFYLHKGHLRTFQRRFDESQELLQRACEIFQAEEQTLRLIQTRVALGYSLVLQGLYERALAEYDDARKSAEIMKHPDPYLLFTVYSGIAAIRLSKGELFEAGESLSRASGFAEKTGSSGILSILLWQQGLLAHHRGFPVRAEELLRSALGKLEKSGDLGNSALLMLDLASISLGQGNVAEAKVLTFRAVRCLRALELQPELLASIRMLGEMAEDHQFSAEVLLKARDNMQIQFGAPYWKPDFGKMRL